MMGLAVLEVVAIIIFCNTVFANYIVIPSWVHWASWIGAISFVSLGAFLILGGDE